MSDAHLHDEDQVLIDFAVARAALDPTRPSPEAEAPETEEQWAALIRPDLERGNAFYIKAGRKFDHAKEALKQTNGSFIHLVTVLLGLDLSKVERWMAIARHPVLSDSATSPISHVLEHALPAFADPGGASPSNTERRTGISSAHLQGCPPAQEERRRP